MNQTEHKRALCQRRDKEFLDLYIPTLDAMIKQGVPHPQMAAASFTIANGHPHYHVDFVNAYRRVCHLLRAQEKNRHNARDYDLETETGLAVERQRRLMWLEITQRVRELHNQGLSVEQAIYHVLEHCRASRFFITPSTALTKICAHVRSRAIRG